MHAQLAAIALLASALGVFQEPRQPSVLEIAATSGRYVSLHDQARRFFEAVRLGDKRTLVALALPEARGVVQKDLENPTSRLSRILLTGSRAMRGRFMAVRAPRVVLLRHPDLVGRGDGTTVCFSDPSQAFKTPASVADLPPVESNRAEMCVFFVYAGRRWAITYDLAYPD
jgi:hypothetical protein